MENCLKTGDGALVALKGFKPARYNRFQTAVVFRDVLTVDEAKARYMTRWAIRVLIEG